MTKKYSQDHEWVEMIAPQENIACVGITDYAQKQLGDIVYVDLPSIGKKVERGKEAAVVESVKAASEVYAPVSGEIIEINDKLSHEPGLVNTTPLQEGWFFKIKLNDPSQLSQLMSENEYQDYTNKLA